MKKPIVILISLLLVGFVVFRVFQNYKTKKDARNRPTAVKVLPVQVITPELRMINEKIRATGNLLPESEITIYSKVSGKVLVNRVHLGDRVRPGDVVAVVNRDEIGYDYKSYEVRSDVKGYVSRVLQNPGAAVGPSIPLMILVEVDTVKAVAAVDEMKIRFVKIGEAAQVLLQAYPGETFPARVTAISPVGNPLNRTVDIEATVPNSQHRLKPGMYAEVELNQSQRKALLLPIGAVTERGGQKYVFLAREGRADMVTVDTGTVVGDRMEIVSGLEGGETVVADGADKLNNKDHIRIIPR